MAEVSMNRAGIVMGLEVSRLARRFQLDWHRLLEICALTHTLLLDEEGLYDPSNFNDRLLLGLKGTMSEVELHQIRLRLRGGILQKARRGELGGRLPTGLVYGPRGQVELDPDRQVQESFRHLFQTFRRTGSALAVMKAFNQEGLKFPRRVWGGSEKGEIIWGKLTYYRVTWVLGCPRYAGAYSFGRTRSLKLPSGRIKHTKKKLAPEEWYAFIPNAHAGYISWEEYQENQKKLQENATQYRCQRQRTPPREGPALLQGLAICGKCGRRMQVQYHERRGHLYPDYVCGANATRYGKKQCQHIPGHNIDRAMSQLLLETVNPLNLEVALAVHGKWKLDSKKSIASGAKWCSGLNKKRTWRAPATCKSIPTTASWPINWKRTGTVNCGPCIQLKRNTKSRSRTSKKSSIRNSVRKS